MTLKQRRLIQSIKRASDILGIFIQEKRTMGITDFAHRLALPKTTISSIVRTLEALKFLEKDHITSKYRLGPALFQLGMKYATNMDLVIIARAWMERLCFQFMEPVNVGMLVGDKVIVVLRVEPENRFMVFPQAGSVIPVHTTCIGKLLHAHLSPDERGALLKNYSFEKLTANTIDDRERFIAELDRVKHEGVAFDNEESIVGLAGIGGPIFNYTGQAVAAFVITGKAENIRKNREKMITAVRYTTGQVSAQLGYSP
ncbi:MAG TPA: IclR family transcriptional regulator [Spirochaetota bacterium]|nr:IclR family transcriptional regulator [Spirochaetota bacterium]